MKKPIELSIQRAALEFGVSRETIRKAMNGATDKLTIRTVHEALSGGDIKAERLRGQRIANERAEAEQAIEQGDLHRLAEVERIVWNELLSPLREAWKGYPSTTGVKLREMLRANGVADDVAKSAAEIACDGVEAILKTIRGTKPDHV